MENINILENNDLDKILSPTIKLLGEILGEVIAEQHGIEALELEEKIRLLSKSVRESNDIESVTNLDEIIENLDKNQRIVIIRAFSIFFQLVNLADEYYTVKKDSFHIHQTNDTSGIIHQSVDPIEKIFEEINKYNLTTESFFEILNKISCQLVWTSHPTEARRLTVLLKLREIYSILNQIQNSKIQSIEWINYRNKLKEQITILWQTNDLRLNVDLIDEVRTVLYYFENSVFDNIPLIYKKLKIITHKYYKTSNIWKIPKILEFGSWVGGDRDGHPHVTSILTLQTLLLQKRLCLKKYIESVKALIHQLSSSTTIVDVSNELKQSLLNDATLFPKFARNTADLNKFEPYRKKLDFIRIKLENTLELIETKAREHGLSSAVFVEFSMKNHYDHDNYYYKRSSELYDEIKLIYNSLLNNKGTIIAEGKLWDLLIQIEIFGFHLAPLDLRQHSKIHKSALNEMLLLIGLPSLVESSKERQMELLTKELLNPRPLGMFNLTNTMSDTTNELISTLQVAKESLEIISPRAISTYVISMSKDETDILSLMLLMKEIGLISIDNSRVTRVSFDIAPLFETKEDLENAPRVMENLFNNELYRSLLKLRDNTQEIMIGYSDSSKDVGMLESNFRLLTAQIQLLDVAKQHGIKLKIFHGRGGSVSRGGGPTSRAILSQHPGTVYNIKITEQGEVIGSNYSNQDIAIRHLEGILSAIIIRGVRDTVLSDSDNPAAPKEVFIQNLAKIANQSRIKYESLVKENPNFIPFYFDFTPLDLIERASIGSRPSRRTSGIAKDISSLRAIPWVFSFMQCRLVFPAYFGTGTGLSELLNTTDIGDFKLMYKEWPYFESIINNLQMVLLKGDMNIAEKYLKLVSYPDVGLELFNVMKAEFELTVRLVLQITGNEQLLSNSPNIRESIVRRNPYIDPLSLIQINLLRNWRNQQRPDDLDAKSILTALLLTVNGIAAGLRNTG
ncbi:MAG: phosphoenolpyruvate carboxylase [Candidatus Heimdallarchaeota archaeon]|nr:phosphoenolpyruvate carboxylase [Candidatus Heimdallarchaeota archaeon]